MTTNQLFFADAGLLVTLFAMFGAFTKYYIDAKIDPLRDYLDAKIDPLDARVKSMQDHLGAKIDPLRDQINRLIDYMILHEGKIATLEEKTKKL